MKGQLKDLVFVLLIIFVCPLLAIMHGSAFSQELEKPAQIEKAADKEKVTVEYEPDALDMVLDKVSGLDGEDKDKIRQVMQDQFYSAFGKSGWDTRIVVPLARMALFAFVLCLPVLVVVMVLFYRYMKRRKHMHLIARLIEEGREVPGRLLISAENPDERGEPSDMTQGILLIGIGAGVFFTAGIMVGWGFGVLGLILVFAGLAKLVVWAIERRNERTAGKGSLLSG